MPLGLCIVRGQMLSTRAVHTGGATKYCIHGSIQLPSQSVLKAIRACASSNHASEVYICNVLTRQISAFVQALWDSRSDAAKGCPSDQASLNPSILLQC